MGSFRSKSRADSVHGAVSATETITPQWRFSTENSRSFALVLLVAEFSLFLLALQWVVITYAIGCVALVWGLPGLHALQDAGLAGGVLGSLLRLSYIAWFGITAVGLFPLCIALLAAVPDAACAAIFRHSQDDEDGFRIGSSCDLFLSPRVLRAYTRVSVRAWLWATWVLMTMMLYACTPLVIDFGVSNGLTTTDVAVKALTLQYTAWTAGVAITLFVACWRLSRWLPRRAADFVCRHSDAASG